MQKNMKKIIDRGDHSVIIERDEEKGFVFTISLEPGPKAGVTCLYMVEGKAVREEDFYKEMSKVIDKEIKNGTKKENKN